MSDMQPPWPEPPPGGASSPPPTGMPPPPPAGAPAYGPRGYGPPPPGARLPLSSAAKRLGNYLLEIVLVLVTLFIGWLIWSLVVWTRGQTPAKQILRMRCIKADTGEAASWGRMALRELVGKTVLGTVTFGITTLVSYFTILFGEKRQGVWDALASTIVVDDPEGRFAPR